MGKENNDAWSNTSVIVGSLYSTEEWMKINASILSASFSNYLYWFKPVSSKYCNYQITANQYENTASALASASASNLASAWGDTL